MKNEDFLVTLTDLHSRLLELSASKGEEYKGADDNQFGNFERSAVDSGVTREQVFLVFFNKHMDAIKTWVRDEAAGKTRQRSESIIGRFDDAILFLALARAMAIEQQGKVDAAAYLAAKGRVDLDPHNAARDGMQKDATGRRLVVVCGTPANIPVHPRHEAGMPNPKVCTSVRDVKELPTDADVYVHGRPDAAFDRVLASEVRCVAGNRPGWRVEYAGAVADLGA